MMKSMSIRHDRIVSPTMGVLLIGAVICVWFLFKGYVPSLVLVSIFAVFILGLKKPIWALSALFISQLTIQGYILPLPVINISLRLLLLLVTLLVMANALINKTVDLGPGFKRIAIPFTIYALFVILSNIINNSGFGFVFEEFRNVLGPFLIVVLMPAIITNTKRLKILSVVSFIVIMCSSIIGILQRYLNDEARVWGLGESALDLAYILSVTLMIMAAFFLVKNSIAVKKIYLVGFSVLIAMALYFTATRSALIAVAIGLLMIIFLFLKRFNWKLILTISFVIIIGIEMGGYSQSTTLGSRSEDEQTESSLSRPILYQAGIAIALDNPIFGVGGYQWFDVSPQYESAVDPELIQYEVDRYWQYRTLGSIAPHNDFVKTWAYYGTFAAIAYIWLYLAIMHNLSEAYKRSKKRFVLAMALGLAAGLVTYMANSFYHNLLISLPLFWMIAGFSIVIAKLGTQNKNNTPSQNRDLPSARQTS